MLKSVSVFSLIFCFCSCSSPDFSAVNPDLNKQKKSISEIRMFLEDQKCDSSKRKATEDFNNGKRSHTTLGTVYIDSFQTFYNEYMKDNFNITMMGNCVPDYSDMCYEMEMSARISEKWGANFIDSTYKLAELEFKLIKE